MLEFSAQKCAFSILSAANQISIDYCPVTHLILMKFSLLVELPKSKLLSSLTFYCRTNRSRVNGA